MNPITKLAAAVICALALAACGGGGGGDGGGSGGGGDTGSSTSTSAVDGGGGSGTGSGSSGIQAAYAVTPSVSGVGGAISPSAAVPVQPGVTAAFTLTPSSGYAVGSVGGTCGGALGSNNVYTTKAVTANCTVIATFTATGSGLTLLYETQPAPVETDTASYVTSILALLNQEGAKGYRYLGSSLFTSDSTNVSMIFVKDGMAPSYTYQLIGPDPGDAPSLVSQANAEGAQGYHYEARFVTSTAPTYTYYSLYRKDGGSSATYAYVMDPETSSTADWLTQANGRGQSGYYWLGWFYGYGYGSLYVKNNASNATYTYDAPAAPAALTDLLAQLNSEGANGYRAIGSSGVYLGSGIAWLYVKDASQAAATFTYLSATPQATSAADFFVSQANGYGAQGYAYFGDVGTSQSDSTPSASSGASLQPPATSSNFSSLYFKTSNCNGFLCTALNSPMFQN
jgi:hypothetical protein